MNILSYDYYSVYESKVNHHSPLYSLHEESEYDYGSQLSIVRTCSRKKYLLYASIVLINFFFSFAYAGSDYKTLP
jgi:hypothetical protein